MFAAGLESSPLNLQHGHVEVMAVSVRSSLFLGEPTCNSFWNLARSAICKFHV